MPVPLASAAATGDGVAAVGLDGWPNDPAEDAPVDFGDPGVGEAAPNWG